MSELLKKGAVSLAGAPECPPTSLHYKTLPGGSSDPTEMSFSLKKGEANGGELRPRGYKASEVLAGPGGK